MNSTAIITALSRLTSRVKRAGKMLLLPFALLADLLVAVLLSVWSGFFTTNITSKHINIYHKIEK